MSELHNIFNSFSKMKVEGEQWKIPNSELHYIECGISFW